MKLAIGTISFDYREGFEKKHKEFGLITTEEGILNAEAFAMAVSKAIVDSGIKLDDVIGGVVTEGILIDDEVNEEEAILQGGGIVFEETRP